MDLSWLGDVAKIAGPIVAGVAGVAAAVKRWGQSWLGVDTLHHGQKELRKDLGALAKKNADDHAEVRQDMSHLGEKVDENVKETARLAGAVEVLLSPRRR